MKNYLGPFKVILVALAFGLIGGCSDGSDNPPAVRGQLLDIRSVMMKTPDELAAHLDGLEEISEESLLFKPASNGQAARYRVTEDLFQELWDQLKSYFLYLSQLYAVTYVTVDSNNNPITVSGLLIIPRDLAKDISVPILALQHPTQVLRKYSPSICGLFDPELTVPIGAAIASTGYLVVIADYPGMGVNYDTHPYCQESLAYSVIDIIRVARDNVEKYPSITNTKTRWKGDLYLMGYSEGGYATMVSAKALQVRHAGEFSVSAVAPLDGPYSLSAAMRHVMLTADAFYQSPYFLPYVIAGYDSVYRTSTDVFDFEKVVKNSIPDYDPPPGSNYALELLRLLDGEHTGDEINSFMKKAVPYEGPRSILQDEFIAELEDTGSTVVTTLAENNAYTDWIPEMPLRVFHCLFDDLVPVTNAYDAYDAFLDQGAGDNLEEEIFLAFIPGLGSIHGGAAPVAYLKGYRWIDDQAYHGQRGRE